MHLVGAVPRWDSMSGIHQTKPHFLSISDFYRWTNQVVIIVIPCVAELLSRSQWSIQRNRIPNGELCRVG